MSFHSESKPTVTKVEDGDGDHLHLEAISFTADEERAVLRKIDLVILPFMCFIFFLQYLDKQSLSYAGVFGLVEDLHLTPSQYSWCSSIFYVGQLVSEYPFIYLMSRLPLTKFVGGTIIIWGAICMCLAAPHSYAGFAATRFMLGFAEGAVSPAFVTLTSIWYKKREHTMRTAFWVSMNSIAQTIGCLLMYGIGKTLPASSLAPWRVLFLICGAITVLAGVLFYFLMPGGPNEAWFLTPRQKHVLSLRMAADKDGGDKTSFSMAQFRETMLDPKAWCVFWFGVLVTMQSPVLTFASFIIKGIGYNKLETMLYTAPSGIVQGVWVWAGVIASFIFPRHRAYILVFLSVPPIIGNILLLTLPSSAQWPLIASAWLASCISASMSLCLSLAASNVKGNTKRAIVNTMFFIGYCAGCIGSPQLWTHQPRYREGIITALVTWGLLLITIMLYRYLCVSDNKSRDALASESTDSHLEVILDKHGAPEMDLTDKQDKSFRYS